MIAFRSSSLLLFGVMIFLSSPGAQSSDLVDQGEEDCTGGMKRALRRGDDLEVPCIGGSGGVGTPAPACLLKISPYGVSRNLPPSCLSKSYMTVEFPDGTKKGFTKKRGSSSTTWSSGNAYFNGYSSDGSIFHFTLSEISPFIDGILVDVTKAAVTQFRVGSGRQIAETTLSSDFPPESEPVFTSRRALEELSPFSTTSNNSIHGKTIPHEDDRAPLTDLGSYGSTVDRTSQDIVRIDVAVLWTYGAECRLAGHPRDCTGKQFLNPSSFLNIKAMVDTAIETTNIAFAESGVNARLHLAYLENKDGAFPLDSQYSDGPNAVDKALDYISNPQLCKWCGPSAPDGLQKFWGADLVHMIIDDPDLESCGKAMAGPGIDSIYSVSHWDCTNGQYSFANLIATNLGCKADRGTLNECDNAGDNYGYRDPEARYRTIMAGDCDTNQCDGNAGGGCSRLPFFSFPGKVNSLRMGTSDPDKGTDNVKQLNGAIGQVAAYSTPAPTPAPVVAIQPSCTPSCMSGETGVSLASSNIRMNPNNKSSKIVKVKELKIGDEIQGLNENKEITYCTVEAVGPFGTGVVYGNFTDDHFIFNADTDMVEVHGKNQPKSIQDKFVVLTSCPVGMDESGTAFTAIDGDFCGAFTETMSWSDYLLLHKGILRIIRGTGGYWFHGSSYEDVDSLTAHAPAVCESMLRCMKDEEKCVDFETASIHFIENALTPFARERTYGTFHNIGRHRHLGSASAMVSGGASVRK